MNDGDRPNVLNLDDGTAPSLNIVLLLSIDRSRRGGTLKPLDCLWDVAADTDTGSDLMKNIAVY